MLSGVKVARRISSIECFSNINVFFFCLSDCNCVKCVKGIEKQKNMSKIACNCWQVLASTLKCVRVCVRVCVYICVKAAKLMAASVLIDPAGVCLSFGAHPWLLVACPGNA